MFTAKPEFTCGIRVHYLYKIDWSPVLNENLNCKKGNREEVLSYCKYSVRVFKKNETLVGNITIELSQLLGYFMQEKKENFVSALVVGPRKREVGHVSVKFTTVIKEMRLATILSAETLKIKAK